MRVKASYEFTTEEFRRAYGEFVRLYIRKRGVGWRLFVGLLGWVVFAVIAFALFRISDHSSGSSSTAPGGSTTGAAGDSPLAVLPWFFLFFFVLFMILAFWRRGRRRSRAFTDSAYFGRTCRVEFAEDGFTSSTEVSTTHTAWYGFLRFEETKEFLFLFIAAGQAHMIPKRAFLQPGDLQSAIELAKSHVGAPLRAFPVMPITEI